jgi:hypothetical protein
MREIRPERLHVEGIEGAAFAASRARALPPRCRPDIFRPIDRADSFEIMVTAQAWSSAEEPSISAMSSSPSSPTG